MTSDDVDHGAKLLELAKAALMDDKHHDALQLCDRAALISDACRHDAALMRGNILLDLGDAKGALSSYDSVADPKIPDAELDCARGLALFELARLAEAENALRSAIRGAPTLARGHFALGLIAELLGNGEEAEHFRRARRLEPENYPPQRRTGNEEFQKAVADAIEGLGDGPKEVLRKMSVLVAELPHAKDLLRQDPPASPQSPCMVVGVFEAQAEGDEDVQHIEVGLLLFKRNLERMTRDATSLTQNIRKALLRVLDGTFGGPATNLATNDEPEQESQDEKTQKKQHSQDVKIEDLHAWRQKKGLLPS